jgi:hypothetical protein
MILRYILYLPLTLACSIVIKLLAPLLCLFYVREEITDTVKRLGRIKTTMLREQLHPWIRWCQYPDNAVDEYWWGCYNVDSLLPYLRNATQADYDGSATLRYLCRLMWIWRNTGGGFDTFVFGMPMESGEDSNVGSLVLTKRAHSFQLKGQIPLAMGLAIDINAGWKALNGVDRLTYAGRVFSLRYSSKGAI